MGQAGGRVSALGVSADGVSAWEVVSVWEGVCLGQCLVGGLSA